jgi:hypothetical protein
VRSRGSDFGRFGAVLCLGVFLLAIGIPAQGHSETTQGRYADSISFSAAAGPAHPRSSSTGTPAGDDLPSAAPISASLSVNDPNVEVGASVTFQLTISLVDCGTTFDLSLLGQLTIRLGDGFSYQEPGNTGGPGNDLYCNPYPGPNDSSAVIDLPYEYPNTGSYVVTVQVNWSSGSPVYTNGVIVDVSGSSLSLVIDEWLYAVIGVVGGALVVCFAVRWRLPKPPSLPPEVG